MNLIALARDGDDAAWAMLVEEHQAAVFRLAYLMVGNQDDAEDVAQETFIAAYKSLGTFFGDRSIKSWLLAIAANRARNHHRTVGRYWKYVENFARTLGQVTPSAEKISARNENEHNLWSAIRELKDEDQQVIYLRHFLELSVAETALALNIAPGTVKSRLYRALERLKTIVEERFPDLYDASFYIEREE